jgi:hypothetical protein
MCRRLDLTPIQRALEITAIVFVLLGAGWFVFAQLAGIRRGLRDRGGRSKRRPF